MGVLSPGAARAAARLRQIFCTVVSSTVRAAPFTGVFLWPFVGALSASVRQGKTLYVRGYECNTGEIQMPMSLRLSDDAEEALEEWVDSGRFENKSEAIRAALNFFDKVQKAQEDGEKVLTLSKQDLEELREHGLVLGRELA